MNELSINSNYLFYLSFHSFLIYGNDPVDNQNNLEISLNVPTFSNTTDMTIHTATYSALVIFLNIYIIFKHLFGTIICFMIYFILSNLGRGDQDEDADEDVYRHDFLRNHRD